MGKLVTVKHLNVFDPEQFGQRQIEILGLETPGSSHTVVSLAELGIEKIRIIDAGEVQESDVAVEAYRITDVGKSRVEALADIVKQKTGIKIQTELEDPAEYTDVDGQVVFLNIIDPEKRRNIFDYSLDSNTITKMVFETRIVPDKVQWYAVDPGDPSQVEEWYATFDDKVDDSEAEDVEANDSDSADSKAEGVEASDSDSADSEAKAKDSEDSKLGLDYPIDLALVAKQAAARVVWKFKQWYGINFQSWSDTLEFSGELDTSLNREVFTDEKIKQLSNMKFAFIGVGASGSHMAVDLTSWLQSLKQTVSVEAYDFDEIEAANISNQAFRQLHDIGKPKVEALQSVIAEKCGCEITAHNQRVEKGCKIDADVVFLLVDSMKVRREVFDNVLENNGKTKLVIETRMGEDEMRWYLIDPNCPKSVDKWRNTLYEDKPQAVSACGTNPSIGATAREVAARAVWKFIQCFGIMPEADWDGLIPYEELQGTRSHMVLPRF